MTYLVDTHALLWYMSNSLRLGKNALKIFERCERGEFQIFIPSIVLLEAIDILEKKKIRLDIDKFLMDIREADNFKVSSLDLEIIFQTRKTKKVLELHDRAIVATAQLLGASIITKDKEIKNAYSKTIW